MKRTHTKFHTHNMTESQVVRSKKSQFIIRSKFIIESNFSCNAVFFSLSIFYWNYNNRYWYAFQVQLHFCNSHGAPD